MSQENVDNLRAWLATWNPEDWKRDVLADEMGLLDPEIAYEDTVLPDHAGETYRGLEGVARAAKRWVEGSEWLSVELEEIVGDGDHLVSIHRARSKALHTGIEFDTPLAYAWTFRNGKVIHFKSFLDSEQALKAAGLSA
jgi:ketosteroid isomerase-like protein